MKKCILVLFLFIVGLFIICGCNKRIINSKYDSINIYDKTIYLNSKDNFKKMSFMTNKDDLIYKTSGTDAAYITYEDDSKTDDIIVDYGVSVMNISLNFYENKTIENIMSQMPYKRVNKTVGNIQYQYFEYEVKGIKGYCYLYEYDGSTYALSFEAKIDISTIVDTFIKHVSFN